MALNDLIYDWNAQGCVVGDTRPDRVPLLDDETLRDGLQSPSVRDPDLPDKRDLLHRLAKLGVEAVDVGMPGAGPRSLATVKADSLWVEQSKLSAVAPKKNISKILKIVNHKYIIYISVLNSKNIHLWYHLKKLLR